MRNSASTGLYLGGIAACLVLASAQAQAQEPDWRAVPTYTTVDLSSSFRPDPWNIKLSAGGSRSVGSSLGSNCTGFINFGAPDVDLNYTPGSYSLFIRAKSDVDTTLVVYGPDRRWYCNDDHVGLDPVVTFNNPPNGNYNIWVGVHGSSNMQPAVLEITEVNPQ